jgi:hypothetical protein
MDPKRMKSLEEKAARTGLNDDEASELGRLYAEAEGEPYVSAAEEHRRERAAVIAMEKRMASTRRWPFRLFDRRPFVHARSLEIGQTGVSAEETEHAEFAPHGRKDSRSEAA